MCGVVVVIGGFLGFGGSGVGLVFYRGLLCFFFFFFFFGVEDRLWVAGGGGGGGGVRCV